MNPEEVVEDDAMDWEWEKGTEPSVDEQMRNLREKMAEMSLRVERLERNMPLDVKNRGVALEEVNGLGGVALGR